MPRLKTVGAEELEWLRKQLLDKSYDKLEEIPVTNTNREQYKELAELIRCETNGYDTSIISEGILRKLYHYTKGGETSRFNSVHLDTFYLFLTDGACRRNEFLNHFPALKRKFVIKRERRGVIWGNMLGKK